MFLYFCNIVSFFVHSYYIFMFFHCIFSKEKDFCLCIYQWLLGFSSDCERSSFK